MKKFISWNVNGIRACLNKNFAESFDALDADIFCLQETKVQAGQVELDLVGVGDFHMVDRGDLARGSALFLGAVERELHVLGGEFRAVMEFDAFAKRELIQIGRQLLPGYRESGHQLARYRIRLEQIVVHEVIQAQGGTRGRVHRVGRYELECRDVGDGLFVLDLACVPSHAAMDSTKMSARMIARNFFILLLLSGYINASMRLLRTWAGRIWICRSRTFYSSIDGLPVFCRHWGLHPDLHFK